MVSETVQIPMSDGVAEAWLSRPDGSARAGVLLYIDAIGLRPRIEQMADRIAGWGYTVLAPNVFYRDGAAADLAPTTDLRVPEHRAEFMQAAMARVGSHTPAQARTDLDRYVTVLQERSGGPGDLGVTGYCMGGALALRAAAARPDVFAAAAAFHAGRLATDAPDSVHRVIGSARAEVLAGHADQDRSNPPEDVAAFDDALVAAGLAHTTAIYPGAAHGYTMSDTAMYDEAATERHFRELEGLLARRLG